MFDDLEVLIKSIFTTIKLFVLGITLIIGITCTVNYLDYKLDDSQCIVYVNKQIVYTGRTTFVHIESIGENGNTKHVKIYKDKFHLKPAAHYVSNNVEVR